MRSLSNLVAGLPVINFDSKDQFWESLTHRSTVYKRTYHWKNEQSSSVVQLLTFLLFIVTPIVGVCDCSMFCCTLLYVHSSFAIILMGKIKLVALLSLPSWCLMMVGWHFFVVPRVCLQFVIVVCPDHTHLLFLY